MFDSGTIILEIDAAAAARQARMLPSTVWRVLRLFDGYRNLFEAIHDSPLDHHTTLAVVHRLAELGLIRLPGSYDEGPKRLSRQALEWLERPTPAVQDAPHVEVGLEEALDAALGMECEAPRPYTGGIASIPEAPERTLQDALQLRIADPEWPSEELIQARRLADMVRQRLEAAQHLDTDPMALLDARGASFTNLDLRFFESYQPEVPDYDDFLDLVVEPADPSH
ncbi:MAG: hypothetical protein ABI333_04285 [bacterium]